MATTTKKVIKIAEAAALPGVAPATMRLWVRQGRIRAVKVGREWLINRAELMRTLGLEEGATNG